MKDNTDISFEEYYEKEKVWQKLDELQLSYDILKGKYNELMLECRMYEKLYHETFKKCWRVGL